MTGILNLERANQGHFPGRLKDVFHTTPTLRTASQINDLHLSFTPLQAILWAALGLHLDLAQYVILIDFIITETGFSHECSLA